LWWPSYSSLPSVLHIKQPWSIISFITFYFPTKNMRQAFQFDSGQSPHAYGTCQMWINLPSNRLTRTIYILQPSSTQMPTIGAGSTFVPVGNFISQMPFTCHPAVCPSFLKIFFILLNIPCITACYNSRTTVFPDIQKLIVIFTKNLQNLHLRFCLQFWTIKLHAMLVSPFV